MTASARDPFPEPRICFAVGRIRPCYGRLQEHHVVKQQRIDRAWASLKAEYERGGPRPWSKTRCKADDRNKRFICWGHHQLLEPGARIRVEVLDLPHGFWDYVDEYGLTGHVPAHLFEAAA